MWCPWPSSPCPVPCRPARTSWCSPHMFACGTSRLGVPSHTARERGLLNITPQSVVSMSSSRLHRRRRENTIKHAKQNIATTAKKKKNLRVFRDATRWEITFSHVTWWPHCKTPSPEKQTTNTYWEPLAVLAQRAVLHSPLLRACRELAVNQKERTHLFTIFPWYWRTLQWPVWAIPYKKNSL